MALDDSGSVREALRQEFLKTVLRKPEASEWRTLVLDHHTMRILSSAVTMFDVLEHGFDLVDVVEDESRTSTPQKTCLYLLSPCEFSVEAIIKDFSSSPPRFGRAEVFFSSALNDDLFNKLAQSPAASFMSILREINIEYLAPESRVFHFDSPEFFRMLYSPSLSDLREPALAELSFKIAHFLTSTNSRPQTIRHPQILESLASGIASHLNKIEPSPESGEKSVLLLVDRFFDLTAPIVHEMFYEAMANDITGRLIQGEQYRPPSTPPSNEKDSETKKRGPLILDERDSIYRQCRHLFISDASEFIVTELKKFSKDYISTGEVPKDIKDLKNILPTISKQQELSTRYSMHIDLIHQITEEFKSRDLNTICTLEQDIITGHTVQGKSVKFDAVWSQFLQIVKDRPEGEKKKDVTRLLALIATLEGFKEDLLDSVVNAAQLWPEECAAVINIMNKSRKRPKSGLLSTLLAAASSKASSLSSHHEAMPYDLARYTPPLKALLTDLVQDKLPEKEYLKMPVTAASPATSRPKAAWAKKPEGAEQSPKPRRGVRFVVFVLGGVSHGEIRLAYELSSQLNTDIVIGSTHISSPSQFVRDMRL